MDWTAIIIIIALFALIVIGAFVVFRQRARIDIKVPGTRLHIDASNDPPPIDPAVVVEDAISSEGGLRATDETARGAAARRVHVKQDIEVSSRPPTEPGQPPKE